MTTPTEKQMDQWFREGQRIAERTMTPVRRSRLTEWLFFTQPFRRIIIRISMRLPDESRIGEWIDDRLYPSDAMVMFP